MTSLRPRGFYSIRSAVQVGSAIVFLASMIALVSMCGACIERAAGSAVTSVRSASHAGEGLSPLEEQIAAVRIDVVCDSGLEKTGSGVVIDAQHVLTAAHVVDCPGHYTIGGDTSQPVEMYLDAFSVDADVARLVTHVAVLPVRPASRIGYVGEGDIVCAADAFPERTWACGVVRGVVDGKIIHTATTVHGNSGSGLYDVHGVLVGIVVECHTPSLDELLESTRKGLPADCKRNGGNASALAPIEWMVRP